MKELKDISWQVDEPTYRRDPALSYSTIARFERGGFESLPTLFDEQSSPSLTFGSVVDELITGNQSSFNQRFLVAEFPKLKPSVENVIKQVNQDYGVKYKNLFDVPGEDLLDSINKCQYQSNWGDVKRIESVLKQDSAEYYRLLHVMTKRTMIDKKVYEDALACVQALRSSEATYHYFRENEEGSDIKRYYQLKFKAVLDGVEYRCMVDLLLVDYKNKVIIPCDLKTSSSKEYAFKSSFLKWRYDLQARLYWRIVRYVLDHDEFFKDFELKDFRFIVINKETRRPLIWGFSKTQNNGEIFLGGKALRAPWDIGKELREYLDTNATVPVGIKTVGVNDLCMWIERDAV